MSTKESSFVTHEEFDQSSELPTNKVFLINGEKKKLLEVCAAHQLSNTPNQGDFSDRGVFKERVKRRFLYLFDDSLVVASKNKTKFQVLKQYMTSEITVVPVEKDMFDIMNDQESVRFRFKSGEERNKWIRLISLRSNRNQKDFRKSARKDHSESFESSSYSRRFDFIDKNLENPRIAQKQLSMAKEKQYLNPNNRIGRRHSSSSNSPRQDSRYERYESRYDSHQSDDNIKISMNDYDRPSNRKMLNEKIDYSVNNLERRLYKDGFRMSNSFDLRGQIHDSLNTLERRFYDDNRNNTNLGDVNKNVTVIIRTKLDPNGGQGGVSNEDLAEMERENRELRRVTRELRKQFNDFHDRVSTNNIRLKTLLTDGINSLKHLLQSGVNKQSLIHEMNNTFLQNFDSALESLNNARESVKETNEQVELNEKELERLRAEIDSLKITLKKVELEKDSLQHYKSNFNDIKIQMSKEREENFKTLQNLQNLHLQSMQASQKSEDISSSERDDLPDERDEKIRILLIEKEGLEERMLKEKKTYEDLINERDIQIDGQEDLLKEKALAMNSMGAEIEKLKLQILTKGKQYDELFQQLEDLRRKLEEKTKEAKMYQTQLEHLKLDITYRDKLNEELKDELNRLKKTFDNLRTQDTINNEITELVGVLQHRAVSEKDYFNTLKSKLDEVQESPRQEFVDEDLKEFEIDLLKPIPKTATALTNEYDKLSSLYQKLLHKHKQLKRAYTNTVQDFVSTKNRSSQSSVEQDHDDKPSGLDINFKLSSKTKFSNLHEKSSHSEEEEASSSSSSTASPRKNKQRDDDSTSDD